MDSIHRGSDFLDDKDDEELQDFSASVLGASTAEEDIEIERSGRPGRDAVSSLAESVSKLSLKTCDPCKEEDGRSAKKAVCFCVNCEEYLCDSCEKVHKKFSTSRDHTIYKNLCDPCRFEDKNKYVSGDWYCMECNEFQCHECQMMHKKIKTSRKHKVIGVELQADQRVKTSLQEAPSEENYDGKGNRDSKSSSKSSDLQRPKESTTKQGHGKDRKSTDLFTTPKKTHPAIKPLSECYARFVTQFDASVPGDDTTPDITGSTFLPDGRLLLADNDNAKLKLFDKDFNYLSEYKCPYAFFDVTVVDKSHVTATLFSNNILTFEIEEKLKCISSIQFNLDTYGIACINSSKFVVSDPHSKALYVISDTGTIYSTVDKDKTDKPLFSHQYYVATDKSKSRLFVSDFGNNSVCCLSLNDSFTLDFTYKHDQLRRPYGVAVDHEDNVYVCGGVSNNIHQLSKYGQHKQILLWKESVSRPQTIAFSPSGRTFIVGFENNKIVKVFNME